MKATLASGLTFTRKVTVDKEKTISFMGEEGRVYATPELVRDIEITCRDFILEHADSGEDSVGTRIEIDHIAPTLCGMWAEITVTVVEVKGKAITFEVTARDPVESIAKGKHSRFVVDVAKTKERLKAKAAKAQA